VITDVARAALKVASESMVSVRPHDWASSNSCTVQPPVTMGRPVLML